MFMGQNIMWIGYTININILKAIMDYKDCNILVFCVKIKNTLVPVLVKRVLTILIVSVIVGRN